MENTKKAEWSDINIYSAFFVLSTFLFVLLSRHSLPSEVQNIISCFFALVVSFYLGRYFRHYSDTEKEILELLLVSMHAFVISFDFSIAHNLNLFTLQMRRLLLNQKREPVWGLT